MKRQDLKNDEILNINLKACTCCSALNTSDQVGWLLNLVRNKTQWWNSN